MLMVLVLALVTTGNPGGSAHVISRVLTEIDAFCCSWLLNVASGCFVPGSLWLLLIVMFGLSSLMDSLLFGSGLLVVW